MIWKVLSSDRFEQESLQLAQKLAQMPTKALGLTKKALQLAATNSFEAQLQVEETLQTLAGNSYDYKEGVAAFLEKRAPLFKGE
jgi:2-(1,2-epoxy-1,2-dihydrophenyl)acetyl-CoA isomerase